MKKDTKDIGFCQKFLLATALSLAVAALYLHSITEQDAQLVFRQYFEAIKYEFGHQESDDQDLNNGPVEVETDFEVPQTGDLDADTDSVDLGEVTTHHQTKNQDSKKDKELSVAVCFTGALRMASFYGLKSQEEVVLKGLRSLGARVETFMLVQTGTKRPQNGTRYEDQQKALIERIWHNKMNPRKMGKGSIEEIRKHAVGLFPLLEDALMAWKPAYLETYEGKPGGLVPGISIGVSSQFLSWNNCWKKVVEFEEKNNFQFDFILRTRTDLFLSPKYINVADWNLWSKQKHGNSAYGLCKCHRPRLVRQTLAEGKLPVQDPFYLAPRKVAEVFMTQYETMDENAIKRARSKEFCYMAGDGHDMPECNSIANIKYHGYEMNVVPAMMNHSENKWTMQSFLNCHLPTSSAGWVLLGKAAMELETGCPRIYSHHFPVYDELGEHIVYTDKRRFFTDRYKLKYANTLLTRDMLNQ